jgi:hypothetical protein
MMVRIRSSLTAAITDLTDPTSLRRLTRSVYKVESLQDFVRRLRQNEKQDAWS